MTQLSDEQKRELEYIRQHYNERMDRLKLEYPGTNAEYDKMKVQSVDAMLTQLLKDYWLDEGYCSWDSDLLAKYKRSWRDDYEIGKKKMVNNDRGIPLFG